MCTNCMVIALWYTHTKTFSIHGPDWNYKWPYTCMNVHLRLVYFTGGVVGHISFHLYDDFAGPAD